jgi:hypothetical protein
MMMMMIAYDSQQLVHGSMFNAMGRYHRMRHAACGMRHAAAMAMTMTTTSASAEPSYSQSSYSE